MKSITPDALASIEFEMAWNHGNVSHTDTYLARKVNFWRDFFPNGFCEAMTGRQPGDIVDLEISSDLLVPRHDPGLVKTVVLNQFNGNRDNGHDIVPAYGRFYPKGRLTGMPGIFKDNVAPFRFLETEGTRFYADLNHPLAGKPVQMKARVAKVFDKIAERGGSSVAWLETVTDGPGIQARANGRATDFFAAHPFARSDARPDSVFYEKSRMVNHIDSRARAGITDLYRRLVPENTRVLDLMSSMNSHLPEDRSFAKVTGLGMNAEELAANQRLTGSVVHDLNTTPVLPFDDKSFDAVVCTASIEYLTNPFAVFDEVARVLTQGGVFAVTFSNRWFPPKVTRIWEEIHEFERMGLVSEYFLVPETYDNISTFSMRGLARPADDKYYPDFPESDPVYAVWGYKK
ncbi:methyltransferase domain-containing protein [Desulfosudis oleivorans]|uniref:Methyltransferase type 11 n=1 Tax=Desulfosudis oleivorans (strain DSM 6200 / JCM 39069 / Hxd3) TaxID=96561 RepID=A8ZZU4_DESOH|nr:methyltransferase domain-containing protein [Desulfosudis oleivorans]ABW67344.1 Methyltransferase type 11 [Desulfosudis oleivorans Hxd3]